MTIERASNGFLVFELLVKLNDEFVCMGLFESEALAEEEQAKLNRVKFPIEYVIKPRLVEV